MMPKQFKSIDLEKLLDGKNQGFDDEIIVEDFDIENLDELKKIVGDKNFKQIQKLQDKIKSGDFNENEEEIELDMDIDLPMDLNEEDFEDQFQIHEL